MICCEQDGEVAAAARDQLGYFEIQEFGNKDSYVFKVSLSQPLHYSHCNFQGLPFNSIFTLDFFTQAEESSMTGTWFRALQYYSQCLGGWRRRRRGLPNIMVDPGVV